MKACIDSFQLLSLVTPGLRQAAMPLLIQGTWCSGVEREQQGAHCYYTGI